jgi:peptide/nickel transport system permease protein
MSSAVVIESVFAIPGLGLLVLDSIKRKDIPLVMGCIVLLAIIFFVVTLLMDILYAYIDPRIGASYRTGSKKKVKKLPILSSGK